MLPNALKPLMARLPMRPPMWIACQALNHIAKPQHNIETWRPLHGKFFCLHVTDLNIKTYLSINESGFIACPKPTSIDLCFSAAASDFYRLATRQEDADTLFFSRKLWIEGDTELGLIAKNTFDRLDLAELITVLKAPKEGLNWLKHHSPFSFNTPK